MSTATNTSPTAVVNGNKPSSSSSNPRRVSSSRTAKLHSGSPITQSFHTSVLELGSPVTSPVKRPSHSQRSGRSASPLKSSTLAEVDTETTVTQTKDQADMKTGAISTTLVEEKEVIELVVDPSTVEGDVEMVDEDTAVDDEDGDEGEGEGEVEGEGEEEEGEEGEEGSGSDEDEEDEDEEDDEDEDDEDSGDESEDIGGSPDIVAIDGPNGPSRLSLPPAVKLEPGADGEAAKPTDSLPVTEETAPATGEGDTNVLVPKKKKRVRPRSPSAEEDLLPPPPPPKTIRLERAMANEGQTLEWNILDDAKEHGMVATIWTVAEEDVPVKEGVEGIEGNSQILLVDGETAQTPTPAIAPDAAAGPSSGPLFGLGFGDEDPEEIARRLEEKYGDAKPAKKPKAKKKVLELYDLEDPFIDDSEIMIDEPTHFARPKKEGFFVHSGPLELLEESPAKAKPRAQKTKARSSNVAPPTKPPRKSLSAAVMSRKKRGGLFRGSAAEPISIDDSDGEEKNAAGPSRHKDLRGSLSPPPEEIKDDQDQEWTENLQPVEIDRSRYKAAHREPQLLPPYTAFPPEVRRRLNMLRSQSEKHDWSTVAKGKFPEHLKLYLLAAGKAAYENDMFDLSDREGADKRLFNALPSALPYNEFTIKKLVTKLCYTGYWQWLQDCEEEGIDQLRDLIDRDKEEFLMKYDESHKAWEAEAQEWDAKHPLGAVTGPESATNGHAEPMSIDALVNGGTPNPNATPKLDDVRPPEPLKRFLWTADMREVFSQLLENMQSILDLRKKSEEWNIAGARVGKEWSEAAVKGRLYKKITDSFPEGSMNNGIISREMTKIKGTKKKAQVDQDGDQ